MFRKLKNLALSAGLLGIFAVPLMAPVTAFAVDNQIFNSTCNGSEVASTQSGQIDVTGSGGGAVGNCTGAQGTSGIQNLMKLVINVFSLIVGFVAVVMIIYGGIKYVTSGGDSNNISSAKNTIIYAIIGLVIVAIAQVIVRFVLSKSSTIGT